MILAASSPLLLSMSMLSQADQEAKFGAGMDLTRLHPNNSINSRPDDDPNRCRKGVVNSGFASKRLAEVSKGLEKEQLHKDASSLFSSSFEKDSQLQVPKSTVILSNSDSHHYHLLSVHSSIVSFTYLSSGRTVQSSTTPTSRSRR